MPMKIETEIKLDSDPCVLAYDNKLYVGCEDGSIKTFNDKLDSSASWAAHGVQVFALAAGGDRVYSSSNDGLRIWSGSGDKIKDITTDFDVGTLHIYGTQLFVGDEAGNITIYENAEEKARYNLLEEVKDLAFCPPFLFSVRDLDITVTEIKPDDSKTRYTTRHTMEGRAPLRISGTRLVTMARGGNNLRLHDASLDTKFKKLHEVKASDMIVTSIGFAGSTVWSGGWDGHLRCWKINNSDQLEPEGDLELGACINDIAISSASNTVFVAVAGGRLICISST